MWGGPEGQTARGITKASDVFSFRLVVSKLCSSRRTHVKPWSEVRAVGGGRRSQPRSWSQEHDI